MSQRRIKKPKPKTVTVKLKYPLTKNDGKQDFIIEELTLGRLKAKHFQLFPDSMFEDEGKNVKPQDIIPLVHALSGLDEELVGELDFDDLSAICDKVQDFLA